LAVSALIWVVVPAVARVSFRSVPLSFTGILDGPPLDDTICNSLLSASGLVQAWAKALAAKRQVSGKAAKR